MNWYRRLVVEAGLGTGNYAAAVMVPIFLSLLLAAAAQLILGVTALSIAAGFLSLTLQLEILRLRAIRRVRVITACWPEVVESLQSAFQSGLPVQSAFEDLATFAPGEVRKSFETMDSLLKSGYNFDICLSWLKTELSTEATDRTVEVLRLLNQFGGHSAVEVLDRFARDLRNDIEFQGELAAKQGWVVTTAKLGVVAPWIIVAMLSRRPEAALVYNSATGVTALLGGLGLCLMAYLLIQLLGTETKPKRVFANAT